MVRPYAMAASLATLAILATISSCQPVTTEPAAGIDAVALAERGLPIWNEGDLDLIDELYTADLVRHEVDVSDDLVGIDALKGYVIALRTGFPDFHVTVEEVFAAGDRMVSRWTVTGTQEGAFLDQPPTGLSIQIHGVTIARVVDDRTAEEWVYRNELAAWQQLGYTLAPPAESAAE